MIRVDSWGGEKERLATGFVAAAVWLHRHEHAVDLRQRLGVFAFQDPAFPRGAVLVENTEVERLLPVGPASAPRLKRICLLRFRLLVEIISIEDQRLSPCVEDAPIGFFGLAGAGDVIDFRNVEISSTHQVANVTVVSEELDRKSVV